ncbi:MAG: hypothetical protein ACM3SU_00790 [Acidobacteriota bacterium]
MRCPTASPIKVAVMVEVHHQIAEGKFGAAPVGNSTALPTNRRFLRECRASSSARSPASSRRASAAVNPGLREGC